MLYCMVSIVKRRKLPDFLSLFREYRVGVNQISLGYGTAKSDMTSYLGFEDNEKGVILSVVTPEIWERLKSEFLNRLYINVPDTGIVFTVPMSSIAGPQALAYLTENQNFVPGKESVMRETETELLVVISNQGFNRLVMDAARSAGATGGTLLHARGTGVEKAELFFGVSLASEKDITFIVAPRAKRNAIMKSIMEKAGMESDAKSVVMSLPVSDTAGITNL